jgi:hypothetical protein
LPIWRRYLFVGKREQVYLFAGGLEEGEPCFHPSEEASRLWVGSPFPVEKFARPRRLAAEGWLELGSPTEANEELEKIAPRLRAHPDVLDIRWQIYAAAERWDAAWASRSRSSSSTPGAVPGGSTMRPPCTGWEGRRRPEMFSCPRLTPSARIPPSFMNWPPLLPASPGRGGPGLAGEGVRPPPEHQDEAFAETDGVGGGGFGAVVVEGRLEGRCEAPVRPGTNAILDVRNGDRVNTPYRAGNFRAAVWGMSNVEGGVNP